MKPYFEAQGFILLSKGIEPANFYLNIGSLFKIQAFCDSMSCLH